MKNIIFFLAFILFLNCTFKTDNCMSQWGQTSGPFGGNINCLYTNGSIIYAGTVNGIYLSADNGINWSLYSSSLLNYNINDICIVGSNVFVNIGSSSDTNKVLLSTNSGNSWSIIFNSNNLSNSLRSIISIGSNVFIIRRNDGIYKTTDNGISWLKIKNGFYNTLYVNGNELYAGGYGVLRTTNNGSNWDSLTSMLDCRAICISGSNIFANSWENGLYFSSDNGQSWNTINNGLAYQHIMTLEIAGSNLFVGTESNGVFLTSNSGNNWSATTTGLTCNFIRIIRKIGTIVITGTTYGAYNTTNNGLNWIKNNNGLKGLVIREFYNYNNKLYCVAGGGIFLSSNSGDVWNEINSNLNNLAITSITGIGSIVYIAANGIFKSSNDGTNWINVSTGLPLNITIYDICASGNNLFAGTYINGLYMSSNSGSNWILLSNGLPVDASFQKIESNGSNIYASSYSSNKIYLSSNNGNSWADISSELGGAATAFAFSSNNVYAGRGGVYLSTNNGNNWSFLGLSNSYITSLIYSNPYLIVGTQKGIFTTSDNGVTWFTKNQGFNVIPSISSLAITNNFIFTGPYSVWRRLFSDIIGIQYISSEIPNGFFLSQNYPNPFNPSTNIEFSLPEKSFVKLKVFDITGKEIAELVSENLSAGTFRYEYNAENLPSGIYFYKLDAKKFSETKRMILIK